MGDWYIKEYVTEMGDNVWFGTYVSGFAGATLGGATEAQAHTVARAALTQERYFLELQST